MSQGIVDESPRPPLALNAEGPHRFRQFRQRNDIPEEGVFPCAQLRLITHVHIFSDGFGADAADGLDAGSAPDAGTAGQRSHEAVTGKSRGHIFLMPGLHGLKTREEGGLGVGKTDGCLQKAYFFILKTGYDPAQKVGRREAVRIKNGNKVAGGQTEAEVEISGLVADARFPPGVADGNPPFMVIRDFRLGEGAGFICGIVQ